MRQASGFPRPSRSRAASGHLAGGLVSILAALAILGAFASSAAANTAVTSNITTDTTWTKAGSPYDIDKSSGVSISEGVTLTIEPGVTVDFNSGPTTGLGGYGTIKAVGTAGEPIVFTSHQALEGLGAPGQWYHVNIAAGTASRFSYTHFYYGGYGSAAYAYGALMVSAASTEVSLDHSVFEYNLDTGLLVDGGFVTASTSTFAHNADGIAVSGAVLDLRHSLVANNSNTGLYENNYLQPGLRGSTLDYNTITSNGKFGIRSGKECTEPLYSWPHGESNNVYYNGGAEETGRNLSTSHSCHALGVDWRNNYWGSDVYYYRNAPACAGTEAPYPGHLAYTWSHPRWEFEVPKGPITSGNAAHASTTPYYGCGWDVFDIGPNDFLTSPVEGAPEPPPDILFGDPGLFAPNLPVPKCGDPVNCITGDFHEKRSDLRVPGLNGGLNFSRTYNSLAAAEGAESALGHGWSFEYDEKLELDPSGTAATITEAGGARVTFTEEGGAWTAPAWVQATLVKNEDGSFTYTLPSRRAFRFSGEGRLLSIADPNGNETTLAYTEGRLTAVTDPSGRELTFAYNAAGRIEAVTDPAGHKASFGYDAAGNLTSVTDPGEATEGYEYDSSHLLTVMTNPRGGKTTNAYDASGRVTSQTDPMERKTTWTYGAEATEVTLPSGSVTRIAFADNLPTTITYAYGNTEAATKKYEYDEDLNPVAIVDPDGHKTEYGYDSEGNRTSRKDALGHETTWTYNSAHQVTSTTTPRGEKTTIERDPAGNPTSISRPAPGEATQTTTVKYDSRGLPESVTDPLQRTWSLEHDSRGELTALTDPLGHRQTMAYDEDSRLVSVVSPRGNAEGAVASEYETTIERDAQGRPVKLTDPLGHATEYAYDAAGNLTSSTDAAGHTTKFTYDANNELTAVERPSGALLKTGYDALGHVVSQTDPNEHTTTYVRNPLGRVVEAVDPLERKSSAEYDPAGNLTSFTDAEGRTTTYTYDAANRLTKADYSEAASADVEASYDADGNLTSMVDGTGTSTYAYDQLGRLIEAEDGHGETVGYEYDLGDEQTGITYPNGKTVSRAFNAVGELKSLTDWLGNTTSFAYDPDSAQTATTFPEATGNVDEYAYDRAGQLSEASFARGSETLASLSYTRDKLGRLESLTAAGLPGAAAEAFAYDADGHLTEAGEASFGYNPAGNLTEAPGTTNTYDAASELESGTGLTYAYDKLGERTEATPSSGPATSYGYDQAGNLTSVQRPAEGETPALEVGYSYDGSGLLASRTSGEATGHLTWDVSAPLPLLLGDGQNSYIYGPDGLPVEQVSALGVPSYLHHDQLGSTRLLTSASGEAVGRFTYSPYGKLEASSGTATTPLGFAGQYTDPETGLQYLRARFYDPATGQFMSRDPLEALTREPYAYAGGDPENYFDPSGMGIVGAIVGCGAGEVADLFGGCIAGAEAGNVAEAGAIAAAGVVAAVADSGESTEVESSDSSSSEIDENCSNPSPDEPATTPEGRPLSKHYLNDTGPERNIPGSVVDETIDNGEVVADLPDRTVYYDPKNDITVVESKTTGKIMSARRGAP